MNVAAAIAERRKQELLSDPDWRWLGNDEITRLPIMDEVEHTILARWVDDHMAASWEEWQRLFIFKVGATQVRMGMEAANRLADHCEEKGIEFPSFDDVLKAYYPEIELWPEGGYSDWWRPS